MLDLKTQSQLVEATAAMMRACFAAATDSWTASTYRGLSLWADMLGAGSRSGVRGTWAGPSFALGLPIAWGQARRAVTATPGASYASYRSDGGHAVAQIAAPASEPGPGVDPMHAMLGMWRAALAAEPWNAPKR
jgi:hypothetical protein